MENKTQVKKKKKKQHKNKKKESTRKLLPEELDNHPALKKKLEKIENQPHPLDSCNPFSILSLNYITPIINLSKRVIPTDRCHYNLPKRDTVKKTHEDFIKQFNKGHSIVGSFFRAYPFMITISMLCSIFITFGLFFIVYLTKVVLEEIDQQLKEHGKLVEKKRIFTYLMIIVGYNIFEDVVTNWIWVERVRLTNRLTGGVYGLVYDKILKIGVVNSHEHDEGAIINYLQTDISKFDSALWGIDTTISYTLRILLALGMGIYFFGTQFLVLFGGLILVGILNSFIFKMWFAAEDKWSSATDKRINEMKNILKNIKFIKINALENIFFKKLNDKREKETNYILICTIMSALYKLVAPFGAVASIAAFMYFYFKSDGTLAVSSSTIFLRIFSLLNLSMVMLPAGASYLGDLFVSIKRLNLFLRSKELKFHKIKAEMNKESEYALQIKNGYFFWDKKITKEELKKNEKLKKIEEKELLKKRKNERRSISEKSENSTITIETESNMLKSNLRQSLMTVGTYNNSLHSEDTEYIEEGSKKKNEQDRRFQMDNVNFKAKKGDLTAIIGKIGSGKSSLLYSLLGEMRIGNFLETSVHINDTVCYLAQTPWMINGTVRENILLDKPYDEEKFNWAIKYSALREDVKAWHQGILHLIGDEGTALSGGQRIRVALARCLYQE